MANTSGPWDQYKSPSTESTDSKSGPWAAYGGADAPAEPGLIPTVKRTGGQMLTTAATSIEDVTGPNAVTKAMQETGQGNIDRNPAGITKLSDVVEKPWLAVKESVGQFAPQIGAAAAGGFAGARVGGALGSLAGPGGAAAGAALGGVAGSLVPIFTQEYGGIRQEQKEAGQEDKARALAAAVPATALERVGMGKALNVLKGVPIGAGSVLKEAGKGVLKEGATEGAQNVIEQVGAFKDPTDAENLEDTALSAVMGGIGGGVMGAGAGAIDVARQRDQQAASTTPEPAQPSAPTTTPEAAAPLALPAPDPGVIEVSPDGTARTPAYQAPSYVGDVTDVEPRAVNPVREQVAAAAEQGGALSSAALTAIDAGLSDAMQPAPEQAPPQISLEEADARDQAAYEQFFAGFDADPVVSRYFENDDDIPDFDAASNTSEEDFLRALGATDEDIQDAIATSSQSAIPQSSVASNAGPQAYEPAGPREGAGEGAASQTGQVNAVAQPPVAAEAAPATTSKSAPTNLRDALVRVRQQKQEAANAQAATPKAAPAAAPVPAAGAGAVEAAGVEGSKLLASLDQAGATREMVLDSRLKDAQDRLAQMAGATGVLPADKASRISEINQEISSLNAVRDQARQLDERDRREGSTRSMLQGARQELDAAVRAGAITPEAAQAVALNAKKAGNAVDAGEAIFAAVDSSTTGATSEPTPPQAIQASTQPAQAAAAPAAGPAPTNTAAPAPAGASTVRALSDGAPTANTGAQAAPAPGPQAATAAEPEFTTIKTVVGDSVTVRTADLNSDKPRLRQYTKDGKSKAVPAIHRDNLDLTGDKRAASAKEDADNPFFNVITTKNGSTFANQAAASRELNRLAMGKTHEVVAASEVQDGARGFVIRRKRADAIDDRAETGANQAEATTQQAQAATENVANDTPQPQSAPVGDEQRFAPESGTLGIPRAEMPQVPTQAHGGLVKHLNAQGIEHETTMVDAGQLKPTQAEFSPSKVEKAKEATGDRAVIVSSDGHIIDGHHQALAAAEEGKPVKAIVLDAPVEQALEAVKNSPSAQPATLADAAPAQSPQDFVPAPDGGLDYGEITPEMGKAMRRQAGKIRLQQGDASFGLVHIEQRHGAEIRNAGFESIQEFVADIAKNIDQVWKPNATSQLVALHMVKNDRVMFVQLQAQADGGQDFYTVNTAFPSRAGYVANKKDWEMLWEGRAQPSQPAASEQAPFAVSPQEAGRATTIPSGQSAASVPPNAPAAQPITRADVAAAQQQAATLIAERIDAMTAGEVNTIARRFLPTMGVKPTVSKERNKAAVTDFTKVNPMAAAAEFGVTLPADVRRALDAEMQGNVADGFVEPAATKPAAAPQPAAPAAPIEDAGEKIGGARKDRWRERGLNLDDLDAMTEAEGAELATKANVWKPDYEALSEASEPVTAAMVKTIYDQLAAKPKKNTPEGRRQYVQMMRIVRDVLTEAKGPEAVRNAYLEIRNRAGLNTKDPQAKAAARELLFSVYKGRSDPFVLDGGDLMKVKNMVDDGFPAKAAPWKTRLTVGRREGGSGTTERGIEIYMERSAEVGTPLTREQILDGFYRVSTKDNKTVAFAASKADAEAAAATVYERDMKGKKDGKPEPVRPNLDELKRENLPKRIDRDVSSEDFVRDLGFRGVEFGLWSAQDERQRILNMAYDGLMDLAEIMGVPPKAMSLNGTLGMAFGARGGGRFAAHYEPGKLVINMTKIRGGGSMAHEWAHAMDHYFGELDKPDAYTTQARGASGWYSEDQYNGVPRRRMERVGNEWKNVEKMRLDNLRPEMAAAFDEVMRALFQKQITKAEMVRSHELDLERTEALARSEQDAEMKAMYQNMVQNKREALNELRNDPEGKLYAGRGRSDYAQQAQALSGKSVDGYWVRPTEMFARAFESWVFDKVTAMGARSDYLVHGVEEDRFAGGGYKGNPYPTGEERARINAAFDKLAATIKTKETEKGVAMFSSADSTLPAKPLSLDRVNQLVQEALSGIRGAPPVEVTAHPADVGLQVPAGSVGYGVTLRSGDIYVFQSAMGSDLDVFKTVFHELFHRGVRVLVPKGQYVQTMLDLAKGDSRIQQLAIEWKNTEMGQKQKENLRQQGYTGAELTGQYEALAIEEALAAVAEEIKAEGRLGSKPKNMTIRFLANWLAKLADLAGMKKLAQGIRNMSYNEAERFVMSAIDRSGEPVQAGRTDNLSAKQAAQAGDQTQTENFRRWFGDSKVVDAEGKPLVVYHGTEADFSVFDPEKIGSANTQTKRGSGFYFAKDPALTSRYANREGANVIPAYVRITNPAPDIDSLSSDEYDGFINSRIVVVKSSTQVKSAIGNNGNFDPANADIRFRSADLASRAGMADLASKARDELNRTFTAPGKLSWWHKTVGTMYNLAERSPAFKRVFEAAQGFVDDVSYYATDAAEQAPRLLPKLETWRDIAKRPITAADNAAVAKPVFEGTLVWTRDEAGKPVRVDDLVAAAEKLTAEEKARRLLRQDKISAGMLRAWQGLPLEQYEKLVESRYESQILKAGIVWTPAELKSMFKLTDDQVALYKEFRTATDRSLDTMARSDMLRYGGKDVADLRDMVMDAADAQDAAKILRDHLQMLAKEDPGRAGELSQLSSGMLDRAAKVQELQEQGYAPLSRFGKYTVDVVDANGERQYFGLFETQREANIMAMKMRKGFGQDAVSQGTLSNEEFKLLAGITPESLELFGNMLGLDSTGDDAQDQAFQEYLRRTKTNRSAMRRLIHRQGIAGYSEDVGRVLASFIYSNARQTSAGLHMGELGEAVTAIPKQQGELKDAAVQLSEYVKNPQEEAQAIRGLLFAQYLGGSIASAVVNMSQPAAVTFPWLSQFGGAKQAATELGRAAKNLANKAHRYETDLAAALKHAEEEGTVSPQEVHQLMAQARGSGSLRPGDGTRTGDALASAGNALTRLSLAWGKVFGAAEQVNRRMTYIAAFRIAKAQKMANPAAFAKKAVIETQFTYSKANKMKWGRGAVGATVMTFKTYSVAYLELLGRMWSQGGPEGKKAVLLALGMLMLMGGAGGLPFAEDAEDLVDGLAQLAGYNFNSKKAKQELLESVFGQAGAGFVERGITGLPGMPLDVSGRLGMGNLLPGTGIFKEKTDYTRDVLEVVGPVGDLAKRAASGARSILAGDVGAGLLQIAPAAVRNAAKGADMAATGMYRDDKGYKVLDTSPAEAAMKAIGFQPASVAKVQEANFINQQAKNFYNMKAQEIRAKWARGIFEKDQGIVAEARADLEEWNRKNPEQRIVVSMPAVLKRVREMSKTKDQRIADTAPRAMRQQMREETEKARATL